MNWKRQNEPITIDNEVEFLVNYVYYPAEDASLNYDGGEGYSGARASVEIEAIFYDGNDILPVILAHNGYIEEFEYQIHDYEGNE